MEEKEHQYHILPPSPWPIYAAFCAFVFALSLIAIMHGWPYRKEAAIISSLLVLSAMFFWWRSVISEAIKEKAHNFVVQKGLKIGMALFILSELMFFFVFFWSFFKAWLYPIHTVEELWATSKLLTWPPKGIEPLDVWNIPFTNTLILLLSGTTVTWAHYSVLENNKSNVVKALAITVFLALCFTCLQAYEYYHAAFSFKEEGYKSIYSSNFYMATGFHGLHVIIGTIFLTVCLIRAIKNQFSVENHLGLEFAAWYWHFVDVIWLFLFVFVYWLSS